MKWSRAPVACSPTTKDTSAPCGTVGNVSDMPVSKVGTATNVFRAPSAHDAPPINVPPSAVHVPADIESIQLPLPKQHAPIEIQG